MPDRVKYSGSSYSQDSENRVVILLKFVCGRFTYLIFSCLVCFNASFVSC